MGKLVVMRPRNAQGDSVLGTDAPVSRQDGESSDVVVALPTNLQLWLSAPREGDSSYAAVYSEVSRTIQGALRQWVGAWVREHPEVLERKVSGYSLLAFSCTRPYRGRSTNVFTYDVQQTSVADQALRAAGRVIAAEVSHLNGLRNAAGTARGPRVVPTQVAEFVRQKRHSLHRMFHVETLLMDEILKFTQINIPTLGLEKAVIELRCAFARHLRRFTDEFDLAERTDELIHLATEALRTRNFEENQAQLAA